MAEMVYEAARKAAAKLLTKHWDGALPVKLGGITESLGARKYESDLGPVFSGIVSKKANESPVIVIHSGHSAARRRFSWAHELGHVMERKSIAKDDDYSFTDGRSSRYDLHEFYADEFAGSILMPAEELDRMRREQYTHGQMAQAFGVSVDAVTKRLARLAKHPERNLEAVG